MYEAVPPPPNPEQYDYAGAKVDQFDRVFTAVEGLPDSQMTKHSTYVETIPIVGEVTSFIVQTYRSTEEGVMIFLQIGKDNKQHKFVLPDKVAQAIYRQRDKLYDTSTPASRKRKARSREVKKNREEKTQRKADWAARQNS